MIQGTPEWLEWRRKGIGASDIAAIIGVSPYSTPYQVWLEKTGKSTGFAGNYATQRGSELEVKARARYELVSLEDMPPGIAIHPSYEIVRVSLDGIRRPDCKKILEIKCPGIDSHLTALENKVPDHYEPQVQYQLAATGADELDYFSFYDKNPEIKVDALVEVKPNIDYQAHLICEALKFWALVQSNTPPPLTAMDTKVVDDEKIKRICEEILAKKDTLKKGELDNMKAKVIELGGHSRVRCGRVLVTKSAKSLRLTVGAE